MSVSSKVSCWQCDWVYDIPEDEPGRQDYEFECPSCDADFRYPVRPRMRWQTGLIIGLVIFKVGYWVGYAVGVLFP